MTMTRQSWWKARSGAAVAVAVVAAAALVVGCAGARAAQPQAPAQPAEPGPTTSAPEPAAALAACDATQAAISRGADERAAPYGISQHLAKNFTDGRVAWLMPEAKYQQYVVATGAKKWGRCNDTACYLFAAPAAVIHDAVKASMVDGRHDPAALGKALGLPAANLEGPLRLMTLDVDDPATCVRLPVDEDPGVWKCQTADDTDCFKFGGYTSGGVPELIVIDALVERTTIETVP